MTTRVGLSAALLLIGAGWGVTVPLAKVAVSTGHQPFGLIFWQLVIVVIVLGLITISRRRTFVPDRAQMGLFLLVALFGAVMPDVFFYLSAAKLPAGVLAIIMSSSPLFSLPIALALGNDRFSWRRLAGILIGLMGIILLIAPETSLPERAMVAFVPVALLAPLFYATEGNIVARWGTGGLDSVQLLLGASIVGVLLTLPMALASGQWINPVAGFGLPEAALLIGAVIHALVYAGYVWLVRRAGSVFAAQLAYLVTGCGVLWSILLLGESYSGYVWTALAVMLLGMFLVQPRAREAITPALAPQQDRSP